MGASSSSGPIPLVCVPHVDTAKFMGTWYVIGVLPTIFETKCSNAIERYSFTNENDKRHISIDFTYRNGDDPLRKEKSNKIKSLPQKGWVNDSKVGSEWKVSPFWLFKMPYLIIENDYSTCVIGYPSRKYAWIMARTPEIDKVKYDDLVNKLSSKHGYDKAFVEKNIRKVPQVYDDEERKLRGLE